MAPPELEIDDMTGVRPLLYRSLEPMIDGTSPPGAYDAVRQVCVTEVNGEAVPLAHATGMILEIQTKTKVLQETDDEIPGMLQMMTKTFVAVERDEDDDDQMLASAASPRFHNGQTIAVLD